MKLSLVADEGVDWPIVKRMRDGHHEVVYIAELAPSIDDAWILSYANEKGALLLTADKDFGELVYRQGKITTGVLLIRLGGLSPEAKADVVAAAIDKFSEELLGSFAVIAPGSLRIRRSDALGGQRKSRTDR